MDPLNPEYPGLTPYQFASNTPIANIDIDGLEAGLIINVINWGRQKVLDFTNDSEVRLDRAADNVRQGLEKSNPAINSTPFSQSSKDNSHKLQINAGFAEALGVNLEPMAELMKFHSAGAVAFGIIDANNAARGGDYASMATSIAFIPIDLLQFDKLKMTRGVKNWRHLRKAEAAGSNLPNISSGGNSVLYIREYNGSMKIGTAKRNIPGEASAIDTYIGRYSDNTRGKEYAARGLRYLTVVPEELLIPIETVIKEYNTVLGNRHWSSKVEGRNSGLLGEAEKWLNNNLPDWKKETNVNKYKQ